MKACAIIKSEQHHLNYSTDLSINFHKYRCNTYLRDSPSLKCTEVIIYLAWVEAEIFQSPALSLNHIRGR